MLTRRACGSVFCYVRPRQAQDALDAAALELEAAATERAHLWQMLRDSKPAAEAPVVARQRSGGSRSFTACASAAWTTPA